MRETNSMVFKLASEPWEFDQIHELNYRTFVEEIPQHTKNSTRKLIDKFHKQNTYIICISDEELLGMIALRDERPLSLDAKLSDLDSYLPGYKSILEYRLLAIKKSYRNRRVFSGIMKKAFFISINKGYDIAVISGSINQIQLYQHLGFKPFGPIVGSQSALYQPMYIDLDRALKLKKESRFLLLNDKCEYHSQR